MSFKYLSSFLFFESDTTTSMISATLIGPSSCLTIPLPDPVLALARLSEHSLAKRSPIPKPYIQQLMNKLALMVLLFRLMIEQTSQVGDAPLGFNEGPRQSYSI